MWNRNIGYKTLCNRLPNLWGIRSEIKVIDLNNNFYFFRLPNQYDYLKVITGEPWVILGRYLTVEPWQPQFCPSKYKITSVVIWIQLLKLSCEYYDLPILRAVCNLIGRFVRIDYNTQESNQGKFARVAVELDLSKPLQPRVLVDGKWYEITYENLPHMFFECGRVGHNLTNPNKEPQARTTNSTTPTVETAAQNQMDASNPAEAIVLSGDDNLKQKGQYGSWMVVQHWRRPPLAMTREASSKKESATEKKSGSRYDALSDYEILARPTSQSSSSQLPVIAAPSSNAKSTKNPSAIKAPAKATTISGVKTPNSTPVVSSELTKNLNANSQVQLNVTSKAIMHDQGAIMNDQDQLSIDDFEVDDEGRPDFLCSYCYENFDIASLCLHLEDEHSTDGRASLNWWLFENEKEAGRLIREAREEYG
ncbi:hypothetical protein Tsubulata_008083 [Turnera subulata]|uniref:DUF4283 domain-containing protein n=1 Tax=Turnera subulata TaxID=218843 RepID=A0A9Q0FCQ6_9ROSI|nr:hypothetical protein Tsubulata_008083 [Turnera subulata]